MNINLEDLINILMKYREVGEPTPRETLYIKFAGDKLVSKETITYHTTEGGIVALDTTEDGEVFGLEII